MKKLSILALSTTVAITPDFTETDVNHHTPKTELSTQQADLSFAFDYKNPKRYWLCNFVL